jgi:uncharacterized protein (DUF58 family)
MFAPLVLSIWIVSRSLGGLKVRRVAPKSLTAGELLAVEVRLANPRQRGISWAVVVDDPLQAVRGAGGQPQTVAQGQVLFLRVPAQGTETRVYQGRIVRRGRYDLGPLRVSTRFPLGLLKRSLVFDDPWRLTVYPRLGRLLPAWRDRRRREQPGNRSQRSRQGLIEGDFHCLRDYRPGDSRNWVHWRTTARVGHLIVRQFELQRNTDLAVLLDLWLPPSPQPQDHENVELAVSFAATVIAEHCRLGGSELLLATADDQTPVARGTASAVLLREALEILAAAQATPGDRLEELFRRALPRIPPRGEVMLVSTRPVEAASIGLLAKASQNGHHYGWANRLVCIDAGSPALREIFQP